MTVGNGTPNPLRRLASFLGIQEGYTDVDGRYEGADEETLAALVAAFGVALDGSGGAARALADLKVLKGRRLTEPVVAHRAGRDCELIIKVPEDLPPERVRISLDLEEGPTRGWKLSDLTSAQLTRELPGVRTLRVAIPSDMGELPIGYHHLEVEAGASSARALLISAPSHCPSANRCWGAFMPLYALRRESRDWGTGSFSDLGELISWVRSLGGNLVGTLPILAAFLDDDGTYQGPYLPASRLAWNEAFVDVEALPELKSEDALAASAREWLNSGAAAIGATRSRRADLAATLRQKRPVLELLARSIWQSDSERRRQLDAYLGARPHLRQYAMFSSACEQAGARWQAWPGATARALPRGSVDEDSIRYHLYAQFAADTQIATGDGLYLDLPVGVHPSGFDTWWEPESFAGSVSGGAPPDDFFAGGQTWGFRPLHPENIREQEYRYVVSYLRHIMTRASAIRLDHVMGLHRLWWVPDGFQAHRGAYVRYHADELRALAVLEAYRSGTVVVGEDLGTVPSEVRTAMGVDGMLSSFVFQFESSEQDPLSIPRESTVASLGTHDLPTFRSYWNGWDIAERYGQTNATEAERVDEEAKRAEWRDSVRNALCLEGRSDDEATDVREVLRRLLSYLAASPAEIVLVDLEDLMLETVRQNTPGTGISEGNFSRRADFNFEALTRDPYALDVLTRLNAARANPEREEPG
jgi:4-alpha-glucanotransferase